MINLDRLPTLEALLGESLEKNTANDEDILGQNNYNFLENCNIPSQIKLKIEKDIVFEDFIVTCLTEEKSVEWLYQWYSQSNEVDRKFIFLKIANDEYKHSLIYLNLLILLFPEKDIKTEYIERKNHLMSQEFWSHFYEDNLDFQIFGLNRFLLVSYICFPKDFAKKKSVWAWRFFKLWEFVKKRKIKYLCLKNSRQIKN